MLAINTFCLLATIGLVKGVYQAGLFLTSPNGCYTFCSDEAEPTDVCSLQKTQCSNQHLFIIYHLATRDIGVVKQDDKSHRQSEDDLLYRTRSVNISRCCMTRAWAQLLCDNRPNQVNITRISEECIDMDSVSCNLQLKPPAVLSGVDLFDKLKGFAVDYPNKTLYLVASVIYESDTWKAKGINEDLTLHELRVIFAGEFGQTTICVDVLTGEEDHGWIQRNTQFFRMTQWGESKTLLHFVYVIQDLDLHTCPNKSVEAFSVTWTIFIVASLLCIFELLIVTCIVTCFIAGK